MCFAERRPWPKKCDPQIRSRRSSQSSHTHALPRIVDSKLSQICEPLEVVQEV